MLWSTRISSLLKSSPGRVSRFLAVGLAACSLAFESSPQEHLNVFGIIDRSIDLYFIVFGLLKILAWYANSQIKKLVHGKVEPWDLFKHSGVFDAVFSSLSFYFGHSYVGQWFRLVRLLAISTLSLQQLPHIDVLVVTLSPFLSLSLPPSPSLAC
jgi:exosortase/archaeosortase